MEMFDEYDDYTCACGNYSKDGGWCQECLDGCDDYLEEHEERKRERLAEQQEY